MKISIVQPRVSYFVGGSEKVALKHIEILSQINNNSITLYTVKPVDGQYSPYFLELKRNFPNVVIIELEVPEKYKYIYDEKPETTQSRWDREAILFSNIVHDSLKNQNDDIVVYYYIVDSVYRVLNIPNIVYLGGHPENEIEIYNAFLTFCDATISNSKNVQSLWLQKIERNKVQFNYVLPKGADIHKSFCNHFDNTVPNIVFAGRLIKGKGVDVLIEAFYKTYQKNRDAKLWILGEGIQSPVFVNRVKSLGLDKNVYFEGMVDNVYEYFSSATLCVFPSTRIEGLMTAVIEAMSVGSCVITTKGIGNEELIEDGETGVLVEAGDVEILHKTMENLILNPSLREKIGKEAFAHIANNHSWKKVGALLDQILHEVVNANNK